MGSVEGREEFRTKFYTLVDNPDIQLTSYVCKTKNPKNKGKKNVLVLSTHSKMVYGVTTDDGKKKPAIIKLYDFTKGGTDICDQRIENFTVKVKSRRWTMPALAYLLDTARVNAQTVHAFNNGNNPRSYESFELCHELAESLMMPQILRRYDTKKNYLSSELVQEMSNLLGIAARAETSPSTAKNDSNPCCCCQAARKPKMKRARRSILRCNDCKHPVCKDHVTYVCNSCKS
jgi:hypothetical protein